VWVERDPQATVIHGYVANLLRYSLESMTNAKGQSLEQVATMLGEGAAEIFADPYYEGAEVDDDLVDDAWMMGATQDSFADAGIDLDDPEKRKRARTLFKQAFVAALSRAG
jgi:hypothetical protein